MSAGASSIGRPMKLSRPGSARARASSRSASRSAFCWRVRCRSAIAAAAVADASAALALASASATGSEPSPTLLARAASLRTLRSSLMAFSTCSSVSLRESARALVLMVRASSRRWTIGSQRTEGHWGSRSIRVWVRISVMASRAYHLWSAGTTYHGAASVEVRRNTSAYASW